MFLSLLLTSVLTFVQLNCENLFDFRHDSMKQDIEFTPEGSRRWTERKYWDKLNNISKVIISCGTEERNWLVPDIVALCEVENDSVVRDLAKRSPLRNIGYEYIVTNSPDVRGIDVALLYFPGSFAPVRHYPLRVKPVKGMRPTRDILYVSGRVITGDTVHLFVLHAPSRYSGKKRTEAHRMAVVERIGLAIDSLKQCVADPKIIVSGDFNDYATDRPLQYLNSLGMLNVTKTAKGSNGAKASYKYKGAWNSIDHVLFSTNIMSWFASCRVNDPTFLIEDDEKYGGVMPLRTYKAWKYRKGYSDHLPLVVTLLLGK